MADQIVITEKSSQAKDVRAAVGSRFGDILPAEGHLIDLLEPEDVVPEWKRWSPIVLRPEGLYGTRPAIGGNKAAKLKAIREALRSAKRVWLATDCDREGQLIGQEILEHYNYRGQVMRVLFTAQDAQTIRHAFARAKPNFEYARLYNSAVPAAAQVPGSVSVAIDGTTIKLRTVTYRPTGDGPFPTLIFHHGSGSFERPYDPKVVAQWFAVRGWAVIAPSRRGRGGSEGVDEEGSTCTESAAREGADRALRDIETVTPVLIAQTFVDRSRIAIGGQSRGGILSVAWSGKHPEVRAVVNFVGGWMDSRICRYGSAINQSLLKRGVAWGQPSLWLYGGNDLFYPLEHTRANFAAFQAAGGKGVWHDYKPPEEGLNGHQIGQAPQLWTADMEAYLAERGLPSKDGN